MLLMLTFLHSTHTPTLSDVIIATYLLECTLLNTKKGEGDEKQSLESGIHEAL